MRLSFSELLAISTSGISTLKRLHLQIPARRTGKKIAIIGSGPSGLAAAAQLNKVRIVFYI